MRNLKVSMKLVVSFFIVILLAVIVGIVGIVGMYQINAADDRLYEDNYLPTVMAGNISQTIVEQRTTMRNFVVYDVNNDAQIFKDAETTLDASKRNMESLLSQYKDTIDDAEDQATYDELVRVYNNEWVPVLDSVRALGTANRTEEAKDALTTGATAANKMNELTTKLQEFNLTAGEISVGNNTALFGTMTIIEIIMLVIAVVIALFMIYYISGLISKPAVFMKNMLFQMGKQGVVNFTDDEYRQADAYATAKDEIGASIEVLVLTARRLESVGKVLETVASGDLSADVEVLSERDTMGNSLKKMVDNLNNMFAEINNSTAQVATGSKQIADGAQALAQGSTEQAAAVEQLSSSISEIAHKTKANAEMAGKAANLAGTIKANAEKGSNQMDQMMEAVKEINQASQSINKVIKVIDDIAFQTNILALNAAVEAARAGQHGKGFAVVAEEVRNLAAKSAEAAKDTGDLIANSMEKAELGSRIANETAESLVEIVSGINESTQIVGDIARSSEEQSSGIEQINKGIDQVAQVVQQNSATAEESAAASEEMSGQSNMLEELIAQFKLRDGNNMRHNLSSPAMSRPSPSSAPSTPRKQLVMPEKTTYVPNDDGDFGKY